MFWFFLLYNLKKESILNYDCLPVWRGVCFFSRTGSGTILFVATLLLIPLKFWKTRFRKPANVICLCNTNLRLGFFSMLDIYAW